MNIITFLDLVAMGITNTIRKYSTFLSPLEIMSVPTQKTMGTAWMEIASISVHTPELLSSSPMAIPSNRLCTDRANTTITLQEIVFVTLKQRSLEGKGN